MNTCNFSSKTFSTKYNLKAHQEKALYCLKIQSESKGEQVEPKRKHNCNRCLGEFTDLSSLKRHQKKCQIYLLDTVIGLELEVATLKAEQKRDRQKIAELRSQAIKKEIQIRITLTALSRPITTVRNTIKNAVVQKPLPLKEEDIKELLNKTMKYHDIVTYPEMYQTRKLKVFFPQSYNLTLINCWTPASHRS
jgi:hypothetical protein